MHELPYDEKMYVALMALSYGVAIKRLARSQSTTEIVAATEVISQAFSLMKSLNGSGLIRIISLVHEYSNSDLVSFYAFYEELRILSSELHIDLTES